jgi:hypothetical protein
MRARRRFILQSEKYMIEGGFEFGVRLAVAVFAVAGLACMLFVGVAAAVLLALARRLYRRGDDDAADNRQTTSLP